MRTIDEHTTKIICEIPLIENSKELKQSILLQNEQLTQSKDLSTSANNKIELNSLITQIHRNQNMPFLNHSKQSQAESLSVNSLHRQLQTMNNSSSQNLLKKQNHVNNMSKSTQNLATKTVSLISQEEIITQKSQTIEETNLVLKNEINNQQDQKIQIQQEMNQMQNSYFNFNQQQNVLVNENLDYEYHLNSQNKNQISRMNLPQPQSPDKTSKPLKKLYYVSNIIKGFQSLNYNSPQLSLVCDHFIQTMQSIQFSKFQKIPTIKQIESRQVFFRDLQENVKTLIFDLDETLIHCNDNINTPSDIILPIPLPTGQIFKVGINIRPYAQEILKELSKIYEIVIFTASHSCYANVVLDFIDPNNKYISYRLFRDQCVMTEEGMYVKDLRIIANRSIENMIIVDNAAYSFGFQIDNGIPIISFYDNKDDLELKYLMDYLKYIQNSINIKETNKKILKISEYSNFVDPINLLETLYPYLLNI